MIEEIIRIRYVETQYDPQDANNCCKVSYEILNSGEIIVRTYKGNDRRCQSMNVINQMTSDNYYCLSQAINHCIFDADRLRDNVDGPSISVTLYRPLGRKEVMDGYLGTDHEDVGSIIRHFVHDAKQKELESK